MTIHARKIQPIATKVNNMNEKPYAMLEPTISFVLVVFIFPILIIMNPIINANETNPIDIIVTNTSIQHIMNIIIYHSLQHSLDIKLFRY